MKTLTFVQLEKGNTAHHELLMATMLPYVEELNDHEPLPLTKEQIHKWLGSIQEMQGSEDRHFEFCYDGEELVGFVYGKVDHEDHKGFIKVGYGYIMEFYVLPGMRRKGYGKAMYERLRGQFAGHGVKRMYLTADPVTGDPFWRAMGFEKTGEVSPENGQAVYEREI